MSLRTSKLYSIRLNSLHSFSLFSSLLFSLSLSLSSFTVWEMKSNAVLSLLFLSLSKRLYVNAYYHLSSSSCMMLYAEFLIVFVLYLGIDTRVVYYYGTTQIWFGLDFLLCMCSYLIMVFVRQKKNIMVFNSCFITCHLLLTYYKMAANVFAEFYLFIYLNNRIIRKG